MISKLWAGCGISVPSQLLWALELCRLGSLGHGYHRSLFFQTQNWMRRLFMKWMVKPFQFTFAEYCVYVCMYVCIYIYLYIYFTYTICFDVSTTLTQQPDLEVFPHFLNSLLQYVYDGNSPTVGVVQT